MNGCIVCDDAATPDGSIGWCEFCPISDRGYALPLSEGHTIPIVRDRVANVDRLPAFDEAA